MKRNFTIFAFRFFQKRKNETDRLIPHSSLTHYYYYYYYYSSFRVSSKLLQ